MHIYKQQLSINGCMRTSNLLDCCKPLFYYIKVGFKGSKLYRHVFMMVGRAVWCSGITLDCFEYFVQKKNKIARIWHVRVKRRCGLCKQYLTGYCQIPVNQ